MKTWLILFVPPRLFADGQEKCLPDGPLNLLVQGDIRLVMDHSVCHIYLLRGNLYVNGKLAARNKEHMLGLVRA